MTTMLMSNGILEPAIYYENSADSKEFIHTLSSHLEPILNFDTMNNVTHEGLAQFDNIVNNTDACNANLCDDFAMDFDCSNWPLRHPEQWQPQEVSDWIRTWAQHNGVQDIDVAHLLYNPMAGFELCQLRRDYFTSVCPQYGNMIYDSLQLLINQFRSNTLMSSQDFNFPAIPNFDLLSGNICLDLDTHVGHSPSSASESDRESTSSNLSGVNERKHILNPYFPSNLTHASNLSNLMPETRALLDLKTDICNTPPLPVKKAGRRGRPPKKDAKSRSKGNGKLWEFIRDLLLNPVTNPSFIRWERREDGIFKFVQSDKVAKMWGERKQNPRMTYEKLSRAMRNYYKNKILVRVQKVEGLPKKLIYQIGPQSPNALSRLMSDNNNHCMT